MFYYITSKLPIISATDESRSIKIFIIGSILYIILHAYIFSSSNKGSEYVTKYGKYMYYLWGADLALSGLTGQFNLRASNSLENNNNNNTTDANDDIQEEIMSKEEIEQRLSVINTNVEPEAKFPFMRRDNKDNKDNKQSIDTNIDAYVAKKETNISDTEILLYKK